MDKLPDDILLRIFSLILFTERIVLRRVSRRWSSLLYDHSAGKLSTLFTAARKVIAVDFFNSYFLDGFCILLAGLSRLRHLTLPGTSVTDKILSRILRASSELVELHLTGTRISELCPRHNWPQKA